MQPLKKERRDYLMEATNQYRLSLPGSQGEDYLTHERGFALSSVAKFGLGFVKDPMPGHEKYQDMLAIPYMRRNVLGEWSVASIRFRCIRPTCLAGEKEDHGKYHGKYNTEKDDGFFIYNTVDLEEHQDVIGICEGELDAVMACVLGFPSVGIPGVEAWQKYYWKIFVGFARVHILADNDKVQYRNDCPKCGDKCLGHNPGLEFADKVKGFLKGGPEVRINPMPEGHDVCSTARTFGKEAFLERIV